MSPSFSPRPEIHSKAIAFDKIVIGEIISTSSVIQSFLRYLQNTFESFTKYAEIYKKSSSEFISVEKF